MAADMVAVVATMLRSAARSVEAMDDVAVVMVARDACDAPDPDSAAEVLREGGVAEGEAAAFFEVAVRWVGPTGGAGAAALLPMLESDPVSEPRDVVRVHLLRGAVPSAADQSEDTLVGAAQAVVDELTEHEDLTPGDVVQGMVDDGGLPRSEAARFVATALAVMVPGPHGRCRLQLGKGRGGRRD